MEQALFDLFTPLTPQLNSFNTGLECKTHTLQNFSSLLPFVPQRCLSKPTAVDSSPLPSTARVTGGAGDALARHQNVPLDGNCIGVGNQSTESVLLTSATWWWNMLFGTIAHIQRRYVNLWINSSTWWQCNFAEYITSAALPDGPMGKGLARKRIL